MTSSQRNGSINSNNSTNNANQEDYDFNFKVNKRIENSSVFFF